MSGVASAKGRRQSRFHGYRESKCGATCTPDSARCRRKPALIPPTFKIHFLYFSPREKESPHRLEGPPAVAGPGQDIDGEAARAQSARSAWAAGGWRLLAPPARVSQLLPRQLPVYIRGEAGPRRRKSLRGLCFCVPGRQSIVRHLLNTHGNYAHTWPYRSHSRCLCDPNGCSVQSDRMAHGGAVGTDFGSTHHGLCEARKAAHPLSTAWVGVSLLTPGSSDSWDPTGREKGLFGYEHVFPPGKVVESDSKDNSEIGRAASPTTGLEEGGKFVPSAVSGWGTRSVVDIAQPGGPHGRHRG